MSNNSIQKNGNGGGIGFFGLLAIVFITLKLLEKITWSWVWVLSPLWIPVAIVAIILFFIIIFYSIKEFMTK